MTDTVYTTLNDIEIIDDDDCCDEIMDLSLAVPEVAKPLLRNAETLLGKIEQMLYAAPAFINAVKAAVPEEVLMGVLTDEQKKQLAEGAIKLMTKKDGKLMANLVDVNTKKLVSTISLEKVNISPEFTQAVASYATQMQLAQIAEQIQYVQKAIEEVRQGQEFDRLADAHSCQQKLLNTMSIKNSQLKAAELLRIASDAEDSRNRLMLSQSANVAFIKNQPDTFWGKLTAGAKPEQIDERMAEIRESLNAVNMVSLVEAMAYEEIGESEAAQQSLQYYASFIRSTYLDSKDLVERLDLIDASPENYWSKAIPEIETKIEALPYNAKKIEIGD